MLERIKLSKNLGTFGIRLSPSNPRALQRPYVDAFLLSEISQFSINFGYRELSFLSKLTCELKFDIN